MNRHKEIALKYFAEHPEAKKIVIEKGYKLFPHLAPQPTNDFKPWIAPDQISHITNIVLKEEELYFKNIENAKKILSKIKYEELTGEKLCWLHHTHGIDPFMVADYFDKIDLPNKLHDDYQLEYEKHKQTGREGLIKKEIKVEDPLDIVYEK